MSPYELIPQDPLTAIVTRDELAAWIGLSPDVFEEDDNLTLIADAATEHIQEATGQVLASSAWKYRLWCFPRKALPLVVPKGPVTAVTATTYQDDADPPNATPLAGVVLTSGRPQCLVPARGELWPTAVATPYPGNVEFDLTIGFASVPKWAKLAARQLCTHWFDIRATAQEEMFQSVPWGTERLLRANRLPDLFVEYS